jgi:oligopeptidase B
MSVVYRKGVKLDGSAPLLLYGYGSYGLSIPPTFSSSRLSLLDRGVIFAIGHIRGGGELGEEWRQAGRMMKKMNTFTDFIACAEALVKQKYTCGPICSRQWFRKCLLSMCSTRCSMRVCL